MASAHSAMAAPSGAHERGFTAFVAGIEAALVSYLAYSCGARVDAEDLFQEVCLKLHREWDTVSRMDRPESWVFRVAHNATVNHFRRREIERRALRTVREGVSEAVPAGTDEGDDEVRAAIGRALASLPPEQREAVCLKIWGGRSWTEIGDALGVSDDTAARLFARGLRAIAPMLKGFAP